jgi:RHS repeat-associated protein
MLEDVTPHTGQYATIPMKADFSIFTNIRSGGQSYNTAYKSPKTSDYTSADAPDPESFNDNFQSHWANALLPYHPEYCKLSIAETQLKSSFDFDKRMENYDIYGEAKAQGFISATLVNTDPFFSGVGASYLNSMIQAVNEDYQHGLSMWQIARGAVFCKDLPDNQKDACMSQNPKKPPFVTSNCEVDWDYVWKIFRSLYQSKKDIFVNEYLDGQCPNPSRQDLSAFRLHFISADHLFQLQPNMGNLSNLFTQLQGDPSDNVPVINAIQQTYDQNCRSNIDRWKQTLLECPQIQAMNPHDRDQILSEILEGFVEVCKAGSNESHPFGASDVPNGSSFEKVMQDVFGNHSLSIDELCNPYSIDWPRPYNHQPAMGDQPVLTPNNECVCNRITAIQQEKTQAQFVGTLSEFIHYQYGTFIRQGTLDTLIMGCAGVYPCNFLNESISLPPILQCNTPMEVCISCMEYETHKADFLNKFPAYAGVPFENPSSNQEISANNLFAQYINYQTGFSKDWSEYFNFQKACETYSNNNPFDCQDLSTFLEQFLAAYSGPSWGNACKEAFAQAFNAHFGTYYTFKEIQGIYLHNCGQIPTICIPVITCDLFNDIIDLFYQTKGHNIVFVSDCQEQFVLFFNNYFGTNEYTWEKLVQLYDETCHRELDVCSQMNCYRMQQFLSQFMQNNPNLWLFEDCQERFATAFNAYFSSGLSYQEIENIYSGCGTLVNICMPPYVCEEIEKVLNDYKDAIPAVCSVDDIELNCEDCFTKFFNDALGTNYTYNQILLIYRRVCPDIDVNVCETEINCEQLTNIFDEFNANYSNGYGNLTCQQAFVQFFNERMDRVYLYDEIIALYAFYCGNPPPFCQPIEITLCEQIQPVLEEFMSLHPDPVTELGLNCETAFKNFFNIRFGTNFSYSDIMSYYESLCGFRPTICSEDNCTRLQDIYDSYLSEYGDYDLPQSLCRALFSWYFNQQYGATFDLGYDEIIRLYQNCGIAINICPPGMALTCSKAIHVVDVYNLIAPPLVPGEDCRIKFARFFNRYYGVLWSYDQIANWASGTCNIDINSHFACGDDRPAPILLYVDLVDDADIVIRPPRLCGLNYPIFPPVEVIKDDPCKDYLSFVLYSAIERYELYKQELRDTFEAKYLRKCLAAGSIEEFTVAHKVPEYHYTLYYYDQGGNLVKTVPPQGVKADFSEAWLTDVATKRKNNQPHLVNHTMVTQYRYNTLNQVRSQITPDAGQSEFFYDRLGRLVVSQNAKQKRSNRYSYTLYDGLGRISEVGEKQRGSNDMDQTISRNEQYLYSWLIDAVGDRYQITRTVYDDSYSALCNPGSLSIYNQICQKNLRNRVSYTMVLDQESGAPPILTLGGWRHASFYTYDIHGNVDTLLHDFRTGSLSTNNEFKKIVYKYDLISGKVNNVAYQPGKADAYYHSYYYDAENKLQYVKTSRDSIVWDYDARYSYYKHGPLSRTVLGENQVQGIDYAYTTHGWLKGVNATIDNDGNEDMGLDGANGSFLMNTARDAYGFSLNYFNGDYQAIKGGIPFTDILQPLGTEAKELFNSNIAAMAVNIPKLGSARVYNYSYDQLNRLTSMDAFEGISTSNEFSPIQLDDYRERITYDVNGNILSYLRNGNSSQPAMDDLDYYYYYQSTDPLVNGQRVWKTYKPGQAGNSAPADLFAYSNRLAHVKDNPTYNSYYPQDIDNQPDENYKYDEIGNLIADANENITNIEWTVYGKISRIIKSNNTEIKYTYDAGGNRISKSVNGKETWYVRDASGNVMSIYEKELNQDLKQTEVHLYGSNRLGIYQADVNVDQAPSNTINVTGPAGNVAFRSSLNRGWKIYELSNHLGNVLVTISDRIIQHTGNNTSIDYYLPDVVTANDYAPFGMQLVDRTYQAEGYRYGFNGKEKDGEVYGEGNIYDYGFRIYNPNIGKFLSVDPISRQYPELTPYQFSANRPIDGIDLDGLEFYKANEHGGMPSAYGLLVFSDIYLKEDIWIKDNAVHKIVLQYQTRKAILEERQLENPEEVGNLAVDRYKVKDAKVRQEEARQNRAVEQINKESKASVIGGYVELLKWALTQYNENKNLKEMTHARESMLALNEANKTVKAATECAGFPKKQLDNDGFKADLVNYINDHTLPADAGKWYGDIVKTWGDLIYNNHESIKSKTFDFRVQHQEIIVHRTPVLGGTVRVWHETVTVGTTNVEVKTAQSLLPSGAVVPQTIVKPGN